MAFLSLFDFDPPFDMVDDSGLMVWVAALIALLASLTAATVRARITRSPVDILLQKRAGRSL